MTTGTFIWCSLLHPEARATCTGAIVDDNARYAGNDSILTAWHRTLELPDADLADMGFKKIGGSDLIFRNVNLQTPYATRYPRGEETEFHACPEHEEWIQTEGEER